MEVLLVARVWPSGLNARLLTAVPRSRQPNLGLLVSTSQRMTQDCSPPEARVWPSGLNARALTSPPVLSGSPGIGRRVVRSHRVIKPPSPAEATMLLFRWKATAQT